MKHEKVIILDFGSQYTQLIARRVRELNIYSEIHPFNKIPKIDSDVKAVILSGSPFSVREDDSPAPNLENIRGHIPLLAVCYGAQFLAYNDGAKILPSKIREYGRANLSYINSSSLLFKNVSVNSQVWMSHGDTIVNLPDTFNLIASTNEVEIAAYDISDEKTYGIQFHPEVNLRMHLAWLYFAGYMLKETGAQTQIKQLNLRLKHGKKINLWLDHFLDNYLLKT